MYFFKLDCFHALPLGTFLWKVVFSLVYIIANFTANYNENAVKLRVRLDENGYFPNVFTEYVPSDFAVTITLPCTSVR